MSRLVKAGAMAAAWLLAGATSAAAQVGSGGATGSGSTDGTVLTASVSTQPVATTPAAAELLGVLGSCSTMYLRLISKRCGRTCGTA
jgi:hypothetical protein